MAEFSDDAIGERDVSFITREAGPMLEPLKDPAHFRRVFVEGGVLTWPNGYDWDPSSRPFQFFDFTAGEQIHLASMFDALMVGHYSSISAGTSSVPPLWFL